MATDYGIAAKIDAPKVDPMAMLSTFQGLQKGQLTNKLLGQEVQGKIALGKAVTAATDPATGKTDWDKALGNLSQDSEGAFQVPQLAADTLQRHIQEQNLTQQQLQTSHQKLGQVADLSLSLLANQKDVPLTRDNIIKAVKSNLIDTGILTPQDMPMASSFVQQLGDDPQQNSFALQRMYAQFHPDSEGMAALRGHIQTTDVGPSAVISRTSPIGGGTEVLGELDKGLSPSEAQTPAYTYTDPKTGQQHIVTKAVAAAAGASGKTPEGITSGVPLGGEQTAQANVAQAQTLQQRAAIVPQRKAALSNLANTLDSFTPGPKADMTYTLGALAQQFGKPSPKVTTGVAAQEEFNKLAAQIALDQWGTLGGTGSNEQLATAMKANPNAAMSRMGIKNVAALLQGNEDAIGAQFQAWKKYSAVHGPASYGDFLEGWNRYYDPRVFQAQHMTPGDAKIMLGKMTADERKTFARDKAVAQQAGWLGQ